MIIIAAQHIIPQYTRQKKTDYGFTNSLHLAQNLKIKYIYTHAHNTYINIYTICGMKASKTKPDGN